MADPITISLSVAAGVAAWWYVQKKQNLKGSRPSPPPPQEEPRADLDWKALEDALANSIKSQLTTFATAHPWENFYGFALDCNAYYADILLCLNTPESLEESAREYAESVDPDEIAKEKKDLEWGLGDWRYQGFNLASNSWPTEVPMLDDFSELPNAEDTEEFLLTCCRALVRAEENGAFSSLRRTPEFRVACIDHDEDLATGDERLERVRASS